MHWSIIMSNIGFVSFRLFPNLQISFWQSILDKVFLSFDKAFLSFDNVFVHFRLFLNPRISFWQSRELKPALISPPHTLTSMIPGFHFSQTIIFLVTFFRHELQNKIILDESGYFAFEHYLSKVLNPQLMWQKDKIDKNCFNRIIGHYNAWSVKWSYGKRQNYMNVITTLC